MKKYGIIIILSLFILLVPVAYSGPSDKWSQCTDAKPSDPGKVYTCCNTGTAVNPVWEWVSDTSKCIQPVSLPTPSLSVQSNPAEISADETTTATITATTSNSAQGMQISFSSDQSDTFSSTTCTTDSTGKCSVTVKSSSYHTSTIRASAAGYTSGTATVTFRPDVQPITYTGTTSRGSTITLSCSLKTTTQGISNVKVWAGQCDPNNCFNTRAWATADTTDKIYFNGALMSQAGNAYTTSLTIDQPVGTGIATTCQADASGIKSNWGDSYPMLTVTSPTTYSATFSQSGIPLGTTWGVTVDRTRHTSTTSTLTVSVSPDPSLPSSFYVYDSTVPSETSEKRYACFVDCWDTVTPTSNTFNVSYTTQYRLTMSASPAGTGTTTQSPSSIDNWYKSGTSVSISATPNSGYQFSSWTGSGTGSYSGTANPATITMNSPVSETANFGLIPSTTTTYSVMFAVTPAGSGNTNPSGTNVYAAGSTIGISATPSSGYQFSSWTTGTTSISIASSTSASTTATINGAGTITANFATITETPPITPSISVRANPSTVATNEGSVITAQTSDNQQGKTITFTKSPTTFGTLSSTSCTTGSTGSCTVIFSSTTTGTATITASSTGYTSGSTTVTVTSAITQPSCSYSLSFSPPGTAEVDEKTGDSYTWTVTATDASSAGCENTITYSLQKFPSAGCSASTLSPNSISVQKGGSTTFQVSATRSTDICTVWVGANDRNNNMVVQRGYRISSAPITQVCNYDLSLTTATGDPSLDVNKYSKYTGTEYKWKVKLTDKSSGDCPQTLTYSIPSVSTSGACDAKTNLYSLSGDPNTGTGMMNSVQVNKMMSNEFYVYVKSVSNQACTLTFNFKVGTQTIDPSFTVDPLGAPSGPESPHVSFFDFYGDITSFSTKWEAFYPDTATRKMNVECGLNCDPRETNCAQVTGKGCLPYPYVHGTEELKKGSCGISQPIYDFAQTNKILCLFYDPDLGKTTSTTFINHDFQPIDFTARSSEKITTTVGKSVDLKIDLTNKGMLPDSYTVTLSSSSPESILVNPTTITTEEISINKITSVLASVTSLVDTDGVVTATISSKTTPSRTQTLSIQLSSSLYSLPEFGLLGFLQIIAIATVLYFLIVNRNLIRLKKSRRK